MKKKVCKNCRIFVDVSECPICKTAQFTVNWKGRLNILDSKKSEIAKKIGITVDGEYAIKAR
jgi:DNA-directed RNA polymerase subunit E"